MIFYDKRVLSIFTVYFLVVLAFTTGHEGHRNKTALQSTSNTTSDTQNLDLRNGSSSAEYEWSNNDDYVNDGYLNDPPASETDPIKPEDGKGNGTNTGAVSESEDTSNSEKAPESIESSRPPQNDSMSSSVSPSEQPSTSMSVSGSPSDAVNSSSTDENAISSTTPLPVDDFTSSTDTSENERSSSTPKLSPNPIITEELGDVSNYTSTPITVERLDSSGFRTWALAVFSVLISFAAIFTILYFIRNELIRRRKADQRKLLRGSISSEGYFYGDGDGSTGGKFEL